MSEENKQMTTGEVISRYGVRAQKKYGQNFLTDRNVLQKIVDVSEITPEDTVLEIGSGTGALTGLLCKNAGKVIAVEIDKKLIPVLEDVLREYDNVRLIEGDVLKLDLKELLKMEEKSSIKLVANLPYYITTPIIMKLLEERLPFTSITIMIQKEVADRIKAVPGTKDYGSLSLAVQYFSKPDIVLSVPPSCFIPRPKVGSAVLKLGIYAEKPIQAENEELMFKLIRGAFNQRRKTLVNALCNYEGLELKKENVERAIEILGKKPAVRGEELSLEDFARLSGLL